MTIRIFVTHRFAAFHQWPDAPSQVDFLRNKHRHLFHVRVEKNVSHVNRETEFFILQRQLEVVIRSIKKYCQTDQWSCEAWAMEILNRLKADRVEVSEDGENGAVVEK